MGKTYSQKTIRTLFGKSIKEAISLHRMLITLDRKVANDFKVNAEIAMRPDDSVIISLRAPWADLTQPVRTDVMRFFVELSDSLVRAGFVKEGTFAEEEESPKNMGNDWRAASMDQCARCLVSLRGLNALKEFMRDAALNRQGFEAGLKELKDKPQRIVETIREELAAYQKRHDPYPRG